MKIISKSFSLDDVNDNSACFFDLYTSFTVAIVIVPVDFLFSGGNQLFQSLDHIVQVIEFVLSNFFLFEVDPIDVSIDFGINFVFLGFCN